MHWCHAQDIWQIQTKLKNVSFFAQLRRKISYHFLIHSRPNQQFMTVHDSDSVSAFFFWKDTTLRKRALIRWWLEGILESSVRDTRSISFRNWVGSRAANRTRRRPSRKTSVRRRRIHWPIWVRTAKNYVKVFTPIAPRSSCHSMELIVINVVPVI